MVRKSKLRIFVLMALLSLLLTCLTVGVTYAKYMKHVQSEDVARVARISVVTVANDPALESDKTEDVNMFLAEHRDFSFAITNASEVAVKAQLMINNTAPSYAGKVELYMGSNGTPEAGYTFNLNKSTVNGGVTNVKVRVYAANAVTSQETMKIHFSFEQKD